jgi:dephospho-CoA kinase
VIVDADLNAREVVAPGTPGLAAVVAEFGAGVLAPDGSLDRETLAARVFGDEDARRRLNAIVHPLVGERSMAQIAAAAEADPQAIVVHDVPLLVEAGVADRYDAVIVVDEAPETQLRRLVEQRGMTETDARARMAAQAARADRLAVADYVVTNDGSLEELDAQVGEVWAALAARAGRTMPA